MSDDLKKMSQMISESPWKNTYWFARMLLNGDKYGALGKKDSFLITLTNKLEAIIAQSALTKEEKLLVCKNALLLAIENSVRKDTKNYSLIGNLKIDLDVDIQSLEDIVIFIVTIKYIILPINLAMTFVPSDDKEFSHETAKMILDTLGKQNVDKVLCSWDNLGVKGCLEAERSIVVSEFTKLRSNLQALSINHSNLEDNIMLTAFIQEFERRLGQKRKSRAGNSLEDVATFLFDYYGFKSHPKPDHFQTDIEVDKWFKCKDGWSIGISCKRTLRERWKQVSSADSNALSRYKIKEIWHLTTYDKDLSDEKLTMLGQQRQIFYLSDASERYLSAIGHIGMKNYVRPLSHLIDDITKEQNG